MGHLQRGPPRPVGRFLHLRPRRLSHQAHAVPREGRRGSLLNRAKNILEARTKAAATLRKTLEEATAIAKAAEVAAAAIARKADEADGEVKEAEDRLEALRQQALVAPAAAATLPDGPNDADSQATFDKAVSAAAAAQMAAITTELAALRQQNATMVSQGKALVAIVRQASAAADPVAMRATLVDTVRQFDEADGVTGSPAGFDDDQDLSDPQQERKALMANSAEGAPSGKKSCP